MSEQHCLFCGGHVRADLGDTCERCGAQREATDEKRVGAPCPRCKDVRLHPYGIGPASLHGCARCRGSFLPATEWDALLETAEGGALPSEAGAVVPAPPGQGPSAAQLRDRLACPTCSETMQQLEFGGVSKIVVDVCRLHGIWLDGGELIAVIESVRSKRSLPAQPGPSLAPAAPSQTYAGAAARELASDAGIVVGAVGAAGASLALDVLCDIVSSVLD